MIIKNFNAILILGTQTITMMTTLFRHLDSTTTTTMAAKDQGLTLELKDLGKMPAMEAAALTMELRARTLVAMVLLRSCHLLRKPGKYMMSFAGNKEN